MATNPDGTPQHAALLDAGDVSRLLGVSREWVYAQSRQRTIPSIRLGRSVRFRREAVLRWLDELEELR